MKIQKLTIHNIASIEDAVIDFEASPLADSEVFLITGKTGAGKSTILDAICLALYADTPRLKETKMEGGTIDGDTSVTIGDPRQLMRKNTGEASVSLSFTGSNGVRYQAIWSVQRAYKKPTGTLQPKDWVWKNLDTENKLTKDAEIKEEIKLAIGLSFDQFCRTTLLAQGEFTRFLNSPDKEKAEILEKITGVDVYSKIGKKIYKVTSEKEKAWSTAQQIAAQTPNPSDEEITLKQEKIKSFDAQYAACKQKQDKAIEKRQWIKTDKELSEKLAAATKEHESAIAEAGSDEFKAKETQVRQWNETIDARSWLRAKKAAEDDATRQKNDFGQLAREFADVLGGFGFAEQERKNKEAERNRLPEVKPEEEAKAAEQLKGLRKQRDEAKELVQNITTTKFYIESYITARERREQAEKTLNETFAEIETKKEEASKMEPQLEITKVKRDTCKELLDKQSDTVDKFAQTLRQKLNVGDVCPVCRQEIKSELPHEDELAQLVGGLREAFTEAEKAYTDLVNKKNKLEAEIQAATRQYQSAQDAFEKDNSVKVAKQKVIEACKACGIETIDKTTPQVLESLRASKATDLKELEAKIKELDDRISEYQKLVRQRQAIDLQLTEITGKCQMAKDTIEGVLQLKPDWKTLTPSAVKEMPDLTKKATDVKSKTSTALAQLTQAEEDIKRYKGQLETFLGSRGDINMEKLVSLDALSAQEISKTNSSLNDIRNRVLTTKALKDDVLKKQEEHGGAKPGMNEDDTIETLDSSIADSETKLKEIAQNKGALEKEIETDKQNKVLYDQRKADADDKKADYQKWNRMNQHIGDSTGSKFRKIAQSYVLSSLIRSANSYMNTLTDRYTLKITPGTFVITIEDAYQGFVSRAASTISGGESFLVSLSLALALSDIGQQLAVDTLFIDEGFGTLSGEPLQNAINTLRSLHTKAGRHVGIISHVEELKAKIPVQIQVDQEGNNSSSTVTITV